MVKDNWREVLRLCVACCGDDDVDDVLLAILTPLANEDSEKTARARAVLAVSCLADEPNLGDKVAHQIIRTFSRQVKGDDGGGSVSTTADSAAMELVGLEWETLLRSELIREFCRREPLIRWNPGALCAMMGLASAPKDEKDFHQWLLDRITRLNSSDDAGAIEAALVLMLMAFENRGQCVNGMVEGLLAMLDKNGPSANAAAWALAWFAKSPPWDLSKSKNSAWIPNEKEIDMLIHFITDSFSDIEAVYWVCGILGGSKSNLSVDALILKLNDVRGRVLNSAISALVNIGDSRAVEPLIKRMEDKDENSDVRRAAINALGEIKDLRAVEPLLKRLADEDGDVRQSALAALAKICEDETGRKLLSRDLDEVEPWLEPQDPVGEERLTYAARKLELSEAEVRRRYERLAEKYYLKLEWKVEG